MVYCMIHGTGFFFDGKCNLRVNIGLLELWSPHIEATLYSTTNCKT